MKRLNECGCGCGGMKGGCQKPEGSMAKHDAMECASDSHAVSEMIHETDNLPEWVEAKITLAAEYMNTVKDYLTHHMQKSEMPGFSGNMSQPQFVPTDFKNHLRNVMSEKIQRVDGGWAVYPSKSGKRLGTHPTKKAALKQLAEIEISKHKK